MMSRALSCCQLMEWWPSLIEVRIEFGSNMFDKRVQCVDKKPYAIYYILYAINALYNRYSMLYTLHYIIYTIDALLYAVYYI